MVQIGEDFFNLGKDIYVCSVYFPLKTFKRKNSQNDSDPYAELQNDISKYAALGQIILMGDFNARKESLDQYIWKSIV